MAAILPKVKRAVTDRWTVSAGYGAPKLCLVSMRRTRDRRCWFDGSCSRWATGTGFTRKTCRESPTWYFAQSVRFSSCMAVSGTDTITVDVRDCRNRANLRSPWDTLYPGRDWAHRDTSMKDAKSEHQIMSEIAAHLEKSPTFSTIDEVLRRFLDEMRAMS